MNPSKPFRPADLIMIMIAVGFLIISGWASFAALQNWFGTGWAIPALIGLWFLLRGAGMPVVAIFGATQIWGWSWWLAIPVFLPGIVVLLFVAPMAALSRTF